MEPKTKQTEKLFRSLIIGKAEREAMAGDSRTIELAFASETPVSRWGDLEILSHDGGDYDFSRINDGSHPLLAGHCEYDPDSQIGVVERAWVDGDRVSRAVVRFGNGAKAQEYYRDVKEGIRKNVSVGYDVTGLISSREMPGGNQECRYRWMPTHVAIVPVPADTKAGVGRSAAGIDSPNNLANKTAVIEIPKTNMNRNLQLDPAAADVSGGADVIKQERARERERTKAITLAADALIKDHGEKDGGGMREKIRQLANEAISGDLSPETFSNRALTAVLLASPARTVGIEDCADSAGQRNYSLIRGIQSCIARNGRTPDGLEGEVHQEMVRHSSKDYPHNGFQVPYNVRVKAGPRKIGRRDMQATVFPSGGAVVPSILRPEIIELLRNEIFLAQVGMRTLSGLTGNILIPRQDSPATAYSVSEIAAATLSQQTLSQVAMSPKRAVAQERYSKQFLMQASPDMEAFLRDDLFTVLALYLDYMGINGSGAGSQPLGIMQTPGIGSITFGGTPTYKQMVSMETTLRKANVRGALVYASTPGTKGSLKTVAEALTGATTIGGAQNAIWKGMAEGRGEVNGYEAIDTNQIPNDQVILGDFSQVIMGVWGGLDVVVDPFTLAGNAEYQITVNTWYDFALRHPQAIIVSADSGAQ